MVIGSILENDFKSPFRWKTNFINLGKWHFTNLFCNFLSEKVETIFWENKAKCQKPFKSIFSHMKLSTKWFWSYFEIKNEYSEHLNLACFYFLQTFEWRSRIGFLGNSGKTLKSNEGFWEMVLKLCWGEKQILWTFVIGIFLVFVKFWVRKLKAFIGKAR